MLMYLAQCAYWVKWHRASAFYQLHAMNSMNSIDAINSMNFYQLHAMYSIDLWPWTPCYHTASSPPTVFSSSDDWPSVSVWQAPAPAWQWHFTQYAQCDKYISMEFIASTPCYELHAINGIHSMEFIVKGAEVILLLAKAVETECELQWMLLVLCF